MYHPDPNITLPASSRLQLSPPASKLRISVSEFHQLTLSMRFIFAVTCLEIHYFPILYCILLYEYTTVYLSSLILVDIWIISSSRLLWIMLLWMFLTIGADMCSFLLDIHLGVEWVSHRTCVSSALPDAARYCFHKWLLKQCMKFPDTPHYCQHLEYIYIFFNFHHSDRLVALSHRVFKFCFPLVSNDTKAFFHTHILSMDFFCQVSVKILCPF